VWSRLIFILLTIQKYIKDDHRAGDLPHGAWVSINFRGHGGGKRAALRTEPKEDQLTKEEKIKDKVADLQLTLFQLHSLNNTWANPIATHIEEAIKQGKTVVEESLSHLPVSSLQKLVAHAAASNAEAPRIDFLAKHIFANDFDKIENMSKAIKLCDTAIRTITVIKFYDNYMNKCGRLSWESYKEKLEQVPTFCIHIEPNPSAYEIKS
jgi:hypothetical protein